VEDTTETTTQSTDTQDSNATVDTTGEGDTGEDTTTQGTEGEGENKHPLEPGGKRFNQVYARMGQAERDRDAEREARIRLEGQLAGLMDQGNNTTTTTTTNAPVTEQVIREKYTAGELDQFEALKALAEITTNEKLTKEKSERQLTDAYTNQMASAIKEVNQYMAVAPDLATGEHPRMGEIKAAYNELIGEGYSPDQRTQRIALRQVFGTVETFKRRAGMGKIRSDHHSEDGAGGGIETGGGGKKDPFGDISARQKKYWDERGASVQERESEAKFIRARKKS